MIALGIGLHNLGEGMAIGASFAQGAVGLGTFLVIGFTIHNITEGIGIGAPMAQDRPPLRVFLGLLALARGPAILGTWIGGFAFNSVLAVFSLAVGVGAILQVVYEVTRLILADNARAGMNWANWANLGGLVAGVAFMYFTAFLVKF
jgi:ZIP family zinc transporter